MIGQYFRLANQNSVFEVESHPYHLLTASLYSIKMPRFVDLSSSSNKSNMRKKGKKDTRRQVSMADLEAQQVDEPTTESQVIQDLEESRRKTEHVDAQVQEVTMVMQGNVQKVQERGEKLEDLEGKTARLEESSQQFSKNAKKVKENLKWKQMRRAIIISVVVIVILAVVAGIAAFMIKKNKKRHRGK